MNGPPVCQECGYTKTWREAGVTKAGKPYEAFWACPNYKNHKPKEPQAQQAAQRAPGSTQAPAQARDATGESIEAQAACKAACHAASGMFTVDPKDTEGMAFVRAWIVGTANGMLDGVIRRSPINRSGPSTPQTTAARPPMTTGEAPEGFFDPNDPGPDADIPF